VDGGCALLSGGWVLVVVRLEHFMLVQASPRVCADGAATDAPEMIVIPLLGILPLWATRRSKWSVVKESRANELLRTCIKSPTEPRQS
jgi:hypothetical protein